jgi:REP element-mobilizing transposase RayT
MNIINREDEAAREGEAPAEPHVKRRHPAHGIKYVDGQPTIIFDTFCTKHRSPALANDAFHSLFREVATSATAWLMGRYVIMPDHIHFFAADIGSKISYENLITYLKSQITKGRGSRAESKVNSGGRGSRRADRQPRGAAQQELRPPIVAEFRWQTDHWDTRVRNAEIYEQKWLYFLNNPVRKGLVTCSEDWPYQGEIFELMWH